VFEVIEQTLKRKWQEQEEPEINIWRTSLTENPETVICLYRNNGNKEHFHRFRKLFKAKKKAIKY
jgi:hypothetical protein